MLFKDLTLGMQFKVYSEDSDIFAICEIISMTINHDYILINFNDLNQTTIYGKLKAPIYKFMEFIK